jgi:hypothetical protein
VAGWQTGGVPVRLRPADPAAVAAALERFRAGGRETADLRLLTKHLLALLVAAHPGGAVEVRVPPYAVAQCLAGTRHTRGTPPAVVETDAATWVALAVGDLDWSAAEAEARVRASGERSDLSEVLPVLPGHPSPGPL